MFWSRMNTKLLLAIGLLAVPTLLLMAETPEKEKPKTPEAPKHFDKEAMQHRLAELRKMRGADIAMVYQEPMSALNPVHTIGRQVAEALVLHRGLSQGEAMARAVDMLRKVQIPEAERRVAVAAAVTAPTVAASSASRTCARPRGHSPATATSTSPAWTSCPRPPTTGTAWPSCRRTSARHDAEPSRPLSCCAACPASGRRRRW